MKIELLVTTSVAMLAGRDASVHDLGSGSMVAARIADLGHGRRP
jgi:hypothetical protein